LINPKASFVMCKLFENFSSAEEGLGEWIMDYGLKEGV
jgi:hypothetical protein